MIFKRGVLALFAVALPAYAVPAVGADNINVKVGFIRAPHMRETLSILDIPAAADDGIAGAELAVEDNNTTGGFLGQTFAIEDVPLPSGGDPAAALHGLFARGVFFVLADLPATALLALADAARDKGGLIFNTDAPEDSLREENCRANVFHIAPSYSMLADGLAQYLVWKQWKRWFLIKGSHPEDGLYAGRIPEACKRKGLFRWRPKTRRPMMSSSPPTKARSLQAIFPSAPGIRVRSRARPGSGR
jgi:ABC transporter substrate binding protein (PQQ-dependent alcohol dehydrogenase system)